MGAGPVCWKCQDIGSYLVCRFKYGRHRLVRVTCACPARVKRIEWRDWSRKWAKGA